MSIIPALLSIVILSGSAAHDRVDFTASLTGTATLSEDSILHIVKTENGTATYSVEEFSTMDNLYGSLQTRLEPFKTMVIVDIDVLADTSSSIISLLQKSNFEVIISSAFYASGEAHSKLMGLNDESTLNNNKWPEQTTSSLKGLSKNKISFFQAGLLCLAKPQSSLSSIYTASILAPAAKITNLYLDQIVIVNSFDRKANFVESQLAFVKDSSIFTRKNIIFATINPHMKATFPSFPSTMPDESTLSLSEEESDEEENNDQEMLFEMDL
ncbi:MAG: hypothetical protein K0M45_11505 [Candidatus Paracaedibacteraceae bacterium]|nr:hypothetical protein [Candidatus Paracaedibacteraceae bacterium]